MLVAKQVRSKAANQRRRQARCRDGNTVVPRNGDKVIPSKRGVEHESVFKMGIAEVQLGSSCTIDVRRNCYLDRLARQDETLGGGNKI